MNETTSIALPIPGTDSKAQRAIRQSVGGTSGNRLVVSRLFTAANRRVEISTDDFGSGARGFQDQVTA